MNRAATQTFNTLFNPLSDDTLGAYGDSKDKKALIHALGLVLGWGTVAHVGTRLARRMSEADYYKDQAEEEEREAYRSARTPAIVRMDKPAPKARRSKTASSSLMHADTPRYQLALAVAAASLGAYAGASLANNMEATKKAEALADERKKAEQEYEKLLAKVYKETRSDKTASDPGFRDFMREINRMYPLYEKVASGGIDSDAVISGPRMNPSFLGGLTNATVRMYMIYAAATLALGAVGGYTYFKDKSPERARKKELDRIKKRLAMVDGAQPIVTMTDLPEGSLRRSKAKDAPKKTPASVRVSDPPQGGVLPPSFGKTPAELPEARTPVDKKDPYADILSRL